MVGPSGRFSHLASTLSSALRRRRGLGDRSGHLLAGGFTLILLIAWLGLVARYSLELRGLTLWSRTHLATIVRHEKPVVQHGFTRTETATI